VSKQVWTSEAVIERIRLLHQKGVDLRHGQIYSDNKKLVSAASRHFGSWKAAVIAAGVDYNLIREAAERSRTSKISKWSREKIIEGIKELAEAGESLAAASARSTRPSLFSAAISSRYFGSWRAAVTAAGVDYDAVLQQSKNTARSADNRRRRSIMKKILSLDRDVLDLPQEAVSQRYPQLHYLATKHFGSWEKAVATALNGRERTKRI
jgi:hypothetical protein